MSRSFGQAVAQGFLLLFCKKKILLFVNKKKQKNFAH